MNNSMITIIVLLIMGTMILLPRIADRVRGCTPQKQQQGLCDMWSNGSTSYRSSNIGGVGGFGGFGGSGSSAGGGK